MPPPFSASCMTLEHLLGGDLRLEVPAYQRAYAWTTLEAGQLLDDILLALDDDEAGGDSDYFLGAVVLMEAVAGGNRAHARAGPPSGTHQIVDGLQRLITLTVLLAVLRDIAEGEDPAAAALAGRCILVPTGQASGLAPGLRLILSGETQFFFRDFVQEYGATAAMPDDDDLPAPESRLLAVREHLMSSLVGESPERRGRLIRFLLERCHCAVITARTLDRAHHIFAVLNDRGLPLARGDILKAQILGSVGPDQRARLHERWVDIEHRLGGSLEELFSHLRTIEGRSRARIIDEIRSLVERSGDSETFVETMLAPYAEMLELIRSPEHRRARLPEPVASRLGYLGWLGSHDWVPPLMLYWRVVGGQPDQLTPFLARLDRLAYGLRLLGAGSDKRVGRYRAVIDAIRAGTLNEAGSPLDLSRDEQRLIAYNLRSLHARSQLACKLVLLRLNDAIAGAPQHLDPADFTVEHVLPQKPGRSGQWREWFPTADERERCTQSLGNMILVSRHKNEQAKNLELGQKLTIYFAGETPLPLITREIEGLATWRPEQVKEREGRLLRVLDELWRLGGVKATPETEDATPRRPAPRPRTSPARAPVPEAREG